MSPSPLAIEAIEIIAAFLPSTEDLWTLLDVLPEYTPAMRRVLDWRTYTWLDDGIDVCWPFLRVRAREMSNDATPITTHAAAVAPFVPKVAVTVRSLHECLCRVLPCSHLVTHATVLHSERAGNTATVLADDGTALCDALAGCPQLEAVSIQYDCEDYRGSMAYVNNILAVIERHPRILHLDITGCGRTTTKLAPRTTERIIEWLRSRPVVSLRLHKTDLTTCVYLGRTTLGEALAQAVAASTTLESIELDSLSFFDAHGLKGLPLPATTRVFRWSNVGLTDTKPFGDVVANNLGQSLATASRLEELQVTYTRALCPSYLNAALSRTLPSMPHLHTLNLDGIVFQYADMQPLFGVLPMLPALASLHLDNTRLGKLDAKALAAVLPRCTALRRVLVAGGTYNEPSTAALLAAATAMPRLEHLAIDVAGDCTDGRLERLSPLLATCARTMQRVDLYGRYATKEERSALAIALVAAGLQRQPKQDTAWVPLDRTSDDSLHGCYIELSSRVLFPK